MKPSEILDRAADVIERNGWARQQWFEFLRDVDPMECKVCAGGALAVASGHDPDMYNADDPLGAHKAAIEGLAAHLDLPTSGDSDEVLGHIATWNDASGRTAADVVRELRAAAASEREAGR